MVGSSTQLLIHIAVMRSGATRRLRTLAQTVACIAGKGPVRRNAQQLHEGFEDIPPAEYEATNAPKPAQT